MNVNITHIPKLRFEGYTGNWISKLYGEIYTFFTTNSYSREMLNYVDGHVKNIHYGDIHTKFNTMFNIINERVPFLNSNVNTDKIKFENYCQEKDLVIADASEDYKDIGKTIEIINLNNEKVIAGLHTFLARPNKYDMAKGFAGYLVQSRKFRKQVMTIAQGTKVLSLSSSRMSNLKLFIPTIPEQHKIAAFLSSVDEKINQLKRKKELLEQYKKGVMQQLFSGKMRFKDENGKEYPKWETKRLGNVGNVIRGASPRPQGDKRYYGGNVPRLMVKDVTRDGKYVTPKTDFLTEEGATLSRPCKAGTLTIVCSGTVGIPSFLAVDACIHDGFLALIDIHSNYNSDYIYHNLSTLREKFESQATHGGVFTNLTTSTIKDFEVVFPSLIEQQKIATYLSSIDTKIEAVNNQIIQTQTFKKGILQQMFV